MLIVRLNKITFILIAILATSVKLTAQNKGEVQFLVDVDNGYFEIVIDDTMFVKLYKCQLTEGHHKAKIWSPGYAVEEVSFDVKKDEVTRQYVPMTITKDREQFENEYKDYRLKFHKSLTVPGTSTLAVGVVSTFIMIKSYDTRKQVYTNIKDYFNAPTYNEAVTYKQNILDLNRKYNIQRTVFYSGLGLTIAGAITTFFTYRNFKHKFTEPTFSPESPFKDRFSLHIGFTNFNLAYHFK